MAALCAHMLADKGLLDYDQKVSHYWPEFAQNGKENVTVRMLLHHQVGFHLVLALVIYYAPKLRFMR